MNGAHTTWPMPSQLPNVAWTERTKVRRSDMVLRPTFYGQTCALCCTTCGLALCINAWSSCPKTTWDDFFPFLRYALLRPNHLLPTLPACRAHLCFSLPRISAALPIRGKQPSHSMSVPLCYTAFRKGHLRLYHLCRANCLFFVPPPEKKKRLSTMTIRLSTTTIQAIYLIHPGHPPEPSPPRRPDLPSLPADLSPLLFLFATSGRP